MKELQCAFVSGCKNIMKKHIVFSCLLLVLIISCATTGNTPPRLIKNSLIVLYPPEARIKRLEGTVELVVLVDKMGDVRDVKIAVSSGYSSLDHAAMEIARNAKFKPALVKGKRQAVWVTWPLEFKFENVKFLPEEWVEEILRLHQQAQQAKGIKQEEIIQKIFYRYQDFANHVVDHPKVKYNRYMRNVILKEINQRWDNFWATWPIPFVLFDDFCQRYPNSIFRHEAENYLIKYIKYEIIRLQLCRDRPRKNELNHRLLIRQLYEYLQKNFPDSITPEIKKGC